MSFDVYGLICTLLTVQKTTVLFINRKYITIVKIMTVTKRGPKTKIRFI